MHGDGIIEQGKEAIVGELVKGAKDSPNIREAGKQLAQVAVTVTKAINVCLLPLAAVNFAYDKAKAYFTGPFQEELSAKLRDVPEESIVDPKPSIVGPALCGLAFALDELSLKDMYLSLIATAMDGKVADKVHPSFVEILRQINADEARLLSYYLKSDKYSPVVQVRQVFPNGSWLVVQQHLIRYVGINNGAPVVDEEMSSKIDNMLRLGLITVSYDAEVKVEAAYEWVDERPEIVKYRSLFEKGGNKVSLVRGTIGRTAYGTQFGKVVGII